MRKRQRPRSLLACVWRGSLAGEPEELEAASSSLEAETQLLQSQRPAGASREEGGGSLNPCEPLCPHLKPT